MVVLPKQYQVIKNGTDIERFKYGVQAREDIRKELSSDEEFVREYVEQFLDVKNCQFLLNVFQKSTKIIENPTLLLVGTGTLENGIKKKLKVTVWLI